MAAPPRMQALLVPMAILTLTALAFLFAVYNEGYDCFVLAMLALTVIVGAGLNILLGLAGQVSLGHIGFYAIGAYAVAILTLNGVSFWIALPVAGGIAGAAGFLLALPALRVAGPQLAMVTIAFAFIVQHGAIEWRGLTGGSNGLAGLPPPSLGALSFTEKELAMLAVLLAGASLLLFERIAKSGWGMGMMAVRDSEIAARSVGLNPVVVKVAAFTLSAILTGLAGGVMAPLVMFVSPDSFPFSQSILFLLAVIIGGAGFVFAPVIGAAVVVILPEILSGMAEYQLLFFGALLLAVLWAAPRGLLGALLPLLARRRAPLTFDAPRGDIAAFLPHVQAGSPLTVSGIGISFGGVKAVQEVSFAAQPGEVTSVIGPNGAGKTTVLNMIGGFYVPDTGSIKLGGKELSRAPVWHIAREGVARTYQTTKLFETQSVIDNILIAMRRGRLGGLLSSGASAKDRDVAMALLAFAGYRGDANRIAGDLPHVDRRLVEIARALATQPKVLMLDEPAAGLMQSDKEALGRLIQSIAALGIAVVLVEHDMALVMGISQRIVVLDAGRFLAEGTPAEIRQNPQVLKAYLGGTEVRDRPRKAALPSRREPVLSVLELTAGYGGAPVLENLSFDIRQGETVVILGPNGAGKSTAMRVLSGLVRARQGHIVLNDARIEELPAHRIAALGLALVPEGRQVFPELSVYDNLALGANTRKDADIAAEIEKLLVRFPRLRARISARAGLLSGGEQQMLAIARGLIANPKILLLDEPSLGLAPAMINELYDILAELRDEGVTILLVDQMAALALTVADHGHVLEQGSFVHSGDAGELSSDSHLEAAYLGKVRAAE